MKKIKICGLKREADIRSVNRYLPDYIGFVFAKSSRQVTEEEAQHLRGLLDPRILAVGVFVNDTISRIARICEAGTIQMVQLHGDEEEDYIRRLKQELQMKLGEIPVIKAVRVRSAEQILEIERGPADYLLLDTFTKDSYGGSGKRFDKALIPPLRKPYFIAGGLNTSNVKEELAACRAFAADVSSAVETDGAKDEEKIRELIERIRNDE